MNSEVASVYEELSGSKDNAHLLVHNTAGKPPVGGLKGIVDINGMSHKKDVGQPYKVKTKLPFYDSKGTF